jgi:hypothetical protein
VHFRPFKPEDRINRGRFNQVLLYKRRMPRDCCLEESTFLGRVNTLARLYLADAPHSVQAILEIFKVLSPETCVDVLPKLLLVADGYFCTYEGSGSGSWSGGSGCSPHPSRLPGPLFKGAFGTPFA